MPDVVKHAWTHRPRAQGGTDPIEVEVSSGLPTAVMSDGLRSRTTGSRLQMDYNLFWANDPLFSYSDVVGGDRARYMTINEEGVYRGVWHIGWDISGPDFDLADEPNIQPATRFGTGSPGDLVAGLDDYWSDASPDAVWSIQQTTESLTYHRLRCEVIFSYTVAWWGENPMQIGCFLYTNNTQTFSFEGAMAITQLSTVPMSQVTIT